MDYAILCLYPVRSLACMESMVCTPCLALEASFVGINVLLFYIVLLRPLILSGALVVPENGSVCCAAAVASGLVVIFWLGTLFGDQESTSQLCDERS